MALGEAIIGGSADNTAISFVPAVGVVVLITAVGLNSQGTAWLNITNGALTTYVGNNAGTTPNNQQSMKVFIDNTHYLNLNAVGGGKWGTYHGVQIE